MSDQGTSAEYSRQFFTGQRVGSDRSAQRVVGIVMDLISPSSVVDVGCGVGAWLAAFRKAGVDDVLGLDGEYVPRDMLQIEPERFMAANLQDPPKLDRRFDLAISLEVGEHLPDEASDRLVGTLCDCAPVVMFSAATPLQGGTGHVNERPLSYWAEKFAARGHKPIDAVRPLIWDDENVKFWYRQNTMLYASADALAANARLRTIAERTETRMLNVIHPALLEHRNAYPQITMRQFLPQWLRHVRSAIKSLVRAKA
jgi:SAM-dependent methyltransferase